MQPDKYQHQPGRGSAPHGYTPMTHHTNHHQPRPEPMFPRPRVQDNLLREASLTIEKKQFHFALRENSAGKFCRIIEEAGHHRNAIVIPATGLVDFISRLIHLLPPEQLADLIGRDIPNSIPDRK